MTDMIILHYGQRKGMSEYVVFTSAPVDPAEFERPGYILYQTIILENFPSHSLPLEETMLKND